MSNQVLTDVGNRYKQLDDAVKRGRLDLPTAIHNYAWLARKDLGPGHLAMGNLNAALSDEANDSDASIPFVISTYAEDRDGDVVVPMGCRLHNYVNNPVVFFGHQDNPLPIAKSMNPNGGLTVFPEENRIWAVAYFDKADEDAMNIYGKVKRGFLSATSIAFVPIVARRRDDIHKAHQHEGSPGGWIFDEIDTTEWSVVGVPSNPQATVLQKNLRAGLRDLVDSERRSTSPRLLKALEPYCAKSINESGGCWSGWCPTPKLVSGERPQAKMVAKAAGDKQAKAGCSCHSKTKSLPKAIGPIQVGDVVWVDAFDRGKVTFLHDGKATVQFSDGTRDEYPLSRLDKGIKKTQLDMEHGTTAGEIDMTKTNGVAKMVQDPAFKAAMEQAMEKLRAISASRSGPKFGSESASKQTAQMISDAAKQARAQVDSVIASLAPKIQAAAKAEADARFGSFIRAHLSLKRGKGMAKYITIDGIRYKSMSESSGADGGYVVPEGEQKATSLIRRGDVVKIKPEYQDPGDDEYKWVAIEDEDGGRVKLRPEGTGLKFPGISVFQTAWLVKSLRTKSGPDVEYDQGYVAAWDGRARSTNPYRTDEEGRGPEMRADWDEGWVDGAKERLSGRKRAKRSVKKADQYEEAMRRGEADKIAGKPITTNPWRHGVQDYNEALSRAYENGWNNISSNYGRKGYRKSCSFCRGTGSGCGRPGDCPTCAGKGWQQIKGKTMRRRKALDEEQTMGVDEPMAHTPHETAIADLYKRARDEHAYITEQLGGITPFDPQTGDANKAHADLKEYGDQVGQRLESLKAMFGAHSEKDIDELTAEEKSEVGGEEWAEEEANEPQHMELDEEEQMGMETSGDGIANTGEANLVDRGEIPPDAVENDLEDGYVEQAEDDDVTKAAEDEQLEKDLNGDLDEDIVEATEGEDHDITKGDDHATEEVLERYQEAKAIGDDPSGDPSRKPVKVVNRTGQWCVVDSQGRIVVTVGSKEEGEAFLRTGKSLVWRTRKASTSTIAKVLRAGGGVKRGLDGRRWLVVRSVKKTPDDNKQAACPDCKWVGTTVQAEPTATGQRICPQCSGWNVRVQKNLRRKDLAEQSPDQVQMSLDPAHAEAIKACGAMMKGLAVAHDMPEHHKSALDMHGDALAKALNEGGHEEALAKALKHLKSLSGAPDVPEHHKAAMGHHSKGIGKVLKAMGTEEEPAPVEADEGEEQQVAKTDENDQVAKALMDSLRDSALMLERTSHRVGIKV